MKKRLFGIIGFILSCALVFSACADHEGQNVSESASAGGSLPDVPSVSESAASDPTGEPTEAPAQTGEAMLTDGVYVVEVFSYSGAYVEDGTNDPCEGVCAVRLSNRSSVHYQYLYFTVATSGGEYAFRASTLFAGSDMTVLCEEKKAFTDAAIQSVSAVNIAPFVETPTVHTDTLLIRYTDGFLNVTNLTDAPLSDVRVYYKNTDDNGYFGGITYFASFGDVPAGGTVQRNAQNMRQDTSRVVFATYGA